MCPIWCLFLRYVFCHKSKAMPGNCYDFSTFSKILMRTCTLLHVVLGFVGLNTQTKIQDYLSSVSKQQHINMKVAQTKSFTNPQITFCQRDCLYMGFFLKKITMKKCLDQKADITAIQSNNQNQLAHIYACLEIQANLSFPNLILLYVQHKLSRSVSLGINGCSILGKFY